MATIDVDNLRDKVKAMYQAVADKPHGTFHFEMGYDLASRLGESPGKVLAKAVALYQMAVDADERGDRLAIINPETDEVRAEVTGL